MDQVIGRMLLGDYWASSERALSDFIECSKYDEFASNIDSSDRKKYFARPDGQFRLSSRATRGRVGVGECETTCFH